MMEAGVAFFFHAMKVAEFYELSRTLLEKQNRRGQNVENQGFKILVFRKIAIQKSENKNEKNRGQIVSNQNPPIYFSKDQVYFGFYQQTS